MPKVSVLVAVYNTEKYLDQCIKSLLGQTLFDIEIVCIDDASTDSCPQILQKYADADPRVTVIHNVKNIGQANSRNLGIEICHGEYICFLDSDDWLDADSLEKTAAVLDSNIDIWCSVFRLVKHYEPDGRIEENPSPLMDEDGNVLAPVTGREAMSLSIDWTLHGVYMARAELFHSYPYDASTRYYSDDNTTRLHYLHSPLVAQSDGIYHYRRHSQAGTVKVSMRYFDHIMANHSMRKCLEKEDVSEQDLAHLELCSLYNLLGAYKTYYLHRREFTHVELKEIHRRMSFVLHSLNIHRLPLKVMLRFGYYPIKCYPLFLLQERLFWTLRDLFKR